jgi:hypothetical protein
MSRTRRSRPADKSAIFGTSERFYVGEFEPSAVVAESATTAFDRKSHQIQYFSPQMVVTLGY